MNLRVWSTILFGLFLFAPFKANAVVTGEYLMSQCRAELADYRAKWMSAMPGNNMEGFEVGPRAAANDIASLKPQFFRQELLEAESQLATYREKSFDFSPASASNLAAIVYTVCLRRAALAANGGRITAPPRGSQGAVTAPQAPNHKPSAPALALPAPSQRPAANPAPARTATGPYARLHLSSEQDRGMKVLDTELDRFENGAREYVQETEGKDAKGCVGIVWGGYYDGAKLINTCSFPIEAFWCVDGVDCKPTFSNQSTIGITPNSYSYAMGTSKEGYGRLVRYGACVAGDDIEYRRLPPFQYRCKARRK
jgi:hypothetical protein